MVVTGVSHSCLLIELGPLCFNSPAAVSFTVLSQTTRRPSYFQKSEYDQEISQSRTADKPMAPLGRTLQPSRDIRKTN